MFCDGTGAKLQLFGSSKNGFGFRQSDLDICMVLEGQETIDVSNILNLLQVLRCKCLWKYNFGNMTKFLFQKLECVY